MLSVHFFVLKLNLDPVPNITKIELTPKAAEHRVDLQNIRIYTRETYGNYTFLPKDKWAIEKDAHGRLFIYFTPELAARYIKVHCDFDDRSPADKAEFKNIGADLVRIYYRSGWRIENYTFDALGNRNQERITLTSRSTDVYDYYYYANSNRLKVNGRYAFVYDENGNLIENEGSLPKPTSIISPKL